MTTTLTIRVPVELAKILADRKANASLNVSAFVRRAIERELQRPVVDAKSDQEETHERRSKSASAVLVVQR
jgi:post-segregation antitoxin (ccd killing protein)